MRKEKSVKTPNRFRAIAVILQLSMFINLLPAQSIGSSRNQGKVRLEHFLEKASYARNEEEWMRIAEEGMLSALGGWEGREREEIENDAEYLSAKEDYEKETEKAYIEWKAKRYAEERDALERSVVRKILNESAAEWNYLDSDGNQTRMIEESQVKDARSQWYEYAEGLVDEYIETTDYTSQIMLGIKDYTTKLTEDEKKEIISKANSSYKQIKRNEYRDVLEIESNDLMRYMLYDQYSLRKKTDAEAAAIIATGLANETNVLTTQNMNNVFSQIDTIVEMNEDEIQTAEEQWLSNFSRVMEDSLAKWDEAEREFLIKRSEWEKDAVETYVNDEEVWQKAMDTLKQKRNEWNKDILDKLEKGRSKWARQKNEISIELDKVMTEYKANLENEKNIKEKVLDVEVSTYEKSRKILSMNFEGIKGWYNHWTERYNGLYAYWKTEDSSKLSLLESFSIDVIENEFKKSNYVISNEDIQKIINMINSWKEEYKNAVLHELEKSKQNQTAIQAFYNSKIQSLQSEIDSLQEALKSPNNYNYYLEKELQNKIKEKNNSINAIRTQIIDAAQNKINLINSLISQLNQLSIVKLNNISDFNNQTIIEEQNALKTIISTAKTNNFIQDADNPLFDDEDLVYGSEESLYGWLSNHVSYVTSCENTIKSIFELAGSTGMLKLTGNDLTFSLDELQTEYLKAEAVKNYWAERKQILEECLEYVNNETSTSDTLSQTRENLKAAKEAYNDACTAYEIQVDELERLGALIDEARTLLSSAQDNINNKYELLNKAKEAYSNQQTAYNGVSNDTLKARIESVISKINSIYGNQSDEENVKKSALAAYYDAVQKLYNVERTKKIVELKGTLENGNPEKNVESLQSLKAKDYNADQFINCSDLAALQNVLNSISIYSQKERGVIQNAWNLLQKTDTTDSEKDLLKEVIKQAVNQISIDNAREIEKRNKALSYISNNSIDEEIPDQEEIIKIKKLNLLKSASYVIGKGIEYGIEEALTFNGFAEELNSIIENVENETDEKTLNERIAESDYVELINYVLCGIPLFSNENLNSLINYRYNNLMWASDSETELSVSRKIVLAEITEDVKNEYSQYNNSYLNNQNEQARQKIAKIIQETQTINTREELVNYIFKLYNSTEGLSEIGNEALEKYIAEYIKSYVVNKIKTYNLSNPNQQETHEFPLTDIEFQEQNTAFSEQQKAIQAEMSEISSWAQVSELRDIIKIIKSERYQNQKSANSELDKTFINYGSAYLFMDIISEEDDTKYKLSLLKTGNKEGLLKLLFQKYQCEEETEENKNLRSYISSITDGAIYIYKNSYTNFSEKQLAFLNSLFSEEPVENEDFTNYFAETVIQKDLIDIKNSEIENLSDLYLKYKYEHESAALFGKINSYMFNAEQLTLLETELGNLNQLFISKIAEQLEALTETEIFDYESLYRASITKIVEDYNAKISEDNEIIKTENEKLDAKYQIPLKNAITLSDDYVLYNEDILETFEKEEKNRRMNTYLAARKIIDYDLESFENEWYPFYRCGSDVLYVYLSLNDSNYKLLKDVVKYADDKKSADSPADENIEKIKNYINIKSIINSYSPYFDGDVNQWIAAQGIEESDSRYDIIYESLAYGEEYWTESHFEQQLKNLVNAIGGYATSAKLIRMVDENSRKVSELVNKILLPKQDELFKLNINMMINNTAITHVGENTSYKPGIIALVNATNAANGVEGEFTIKDINSALDFKNIYSQYFTDATLLPGYHDEAETDIKELKKEIQNKAEEIDSKDQKRQAYLSQVKAEFEVLKANQSGMGELLAKLRACQSAVDSAKADYEAAVSAYDTALNNYKTSVTNYTTQLAEVNKKYDKMEEERLHYRSANEIYEWAENTYLRTEAESNVVGALDDNKIPVEYLTPQEKFKLVDQSYTAAEISVEVLKELQEELKNTNKDTVEAFSIKYGIEYEKYRRAEHDYYISRVLHSELSYVISAQRDNVYNLEMEEQGIISNLLKLSSYDPDLHEAPYSMKSEIMKLITLELQADGSYKPKLRYKIETKSKVESTGEQVQIVYYDKVEILNNSTTDESVFNEYLNNALGEAKYDAFDKKYNDRKSQEDAITWLHAIGKNDSKLTNIVLAAMYLEYMCINDKIISDDITNLGAYQNVMSDSVAKLEHLDKNNGVDYPSILEGNIKDILSEAWRNADKDDVAKYLLFKDTYLSSSMGLETRAANYLRAEAISRTISYAEDVKQSYEIEGTIFTVTAAGFYALAVWIWNAWALIPAIAATVAAAYEFVKARDTGDIINYKLSPGKNSALESVNVSVKYLNSIIDKWDATNQRKRNNINTLNIMLYGIGGETLTGGIGAPEMTYDTLHNAFVETLQYSKVINLAAVENLVTRDSFSKIFKEGCTSSEQAVVMIEEYYQQRAKEARAELEKKVNKNENDYDESAELSAKSLKKQQEISSASYYELLEKYLNNEIELFDDNDTSLTEEQKKQTRSKVKEELKKKAKAAWGDGTFRSNVYNSNIVRVFNDNTNIDKSKVRYDRGVEKYIYDAEKESGAINSFREAYSKALQDEIDLKLNFRAKENEIIWNDLLVQQKDWEIQMAYILSIADIEWNKAIKRLNNETNLWRSNYAEEYEKKLNEWNENYTQFQEEKRDWIMSAYMNASEGKWNELTAGYDIEREKIVKNVMEKSGLIGRMKDAVTALSEDTDAYVESLTNSGILKNIMNYASDMSDRADYGIKRAKRGNAISTQADEWLKNALDKADQTNTEYEKTAQKLSEQKAQEQLRETIDGYMTQIDAQNKGMRDWEIETVRNSGYSVNGRTISRIAIIDSTLIKNVTKEQTVAMYEDFKTVRPETDISSSAGQNAQNAMEKIILAMDSVKKWAVKIFGRKDFDENGDAVTRERFIKRKTGTKSADSLIASYEENARALDTEQTELENSGKIKELEDLEKNIKDNGWDKLSKGDQDKYSKLSGEIVRLSDGALNEWIGYAPVMTDKPDYKKDKKANVKYEGYGQMGIIMLDIQFNSMEEGNGFAELAKPMYDKKMWDDDGAWIQPPTFRAVADIVLDIVGNVTGQKWIGYLDDALFATLDLTGGYKTPAEVGLELGKKALTSAASYGISSLGSAASAAASAAITNTTANVAAQAGISVAQSYATNVATSAINSVNLKDGKLDFDEEGFGKSLYSKDTIAGALSSGVNVAVTSGAQNFLLTDGNGIGLTDNVFNTNALNTMAGLTGNAAAALTEYAISGHTTVNLINTSMFGLKNKDLKTGTLSTMHKGLFAVTFDSEEGVSSTISSAGFDMNLGNIATAMNGLHDITKITSAKVSSAFGRQEDISTLNSINMMGYTNSDLNLSLANDIWQDRLGVEYGDTGDDYGNYTIGDNKIRLSDKLLGGGKEGSAKLAAVMSHEGTHAYGNRIEGYAHLAAADTYSQINQMFKLEADSSFGGEIARGILNLDNWKENTGDIDHWTFVSNGENGFGWQWDNDFDFNVGDKKLTAEAMKGIITGMHFFEDETKLANLGLDKNILNEKGGLYLRASTDSKTPSATDDMFNLFIQSGNPNAYFEFMKKSESFTDASIAAKRLISEIDDNTINNNKKGKEINSLLNQMGIALYTAQGSGLLVKNEYDIYSGSNADGLFVYDEGQNGYLTSGYGDRVVEWYSNKYRPYSIQFHGALDIGVNDAEVKKVPILSGDDGTIQLNYSITAGLNINYDLGDNRNLIYNHLDKNTIMNYMTQFGMEGTSISKNGILSGVQSNSIIATLGNTGTESSGWHLDLRYYVNGVNTNPFNYSGYNNALNNLIQYPNIGITSNLTTNLYNNINNVDFLKLMEYSKTYDAKSSFKGNGFNVGNFYWENYWRKQKIVDYSGLML